MAFLEVKNIQKSFGRTEVLKDISFSLEKGEVLAIIGSSGSGKTTLLRCINFLETPQMGNIIVNGEVLFDGDDPSKKKDSEIRKNRLHFGMVFQQFNLFPQYTVFENLVLAPKLLAKEKIKENGWAEDYQNGENQRGRKTTVEGDNYIKLQKLYASTIKQLTDQLPAPTETAAPGASIMSFITGND